MKQKDSSLTGAMLVEDVEVDEGEKSGNQSITKKYFRRLVFRRNPNLIQSEALLIRSEKPLSAKGRRSAHLKRKSKSVKEGQVKFVCCGDSGVVSKIPQVCGVPVELFLKVLLSNVANRVVG